MKFNFTFSFRHFVSGITVLCPLMALIYSIILEDEPYGDWTEDGFIVFLFTLFVIFLSSVLGTLLEPKMSTIFSSKEASESLIRFMEIYPIKGNLFRKRMSVGDKFDGDLILTNSEIYQYMNSFVISKNDNLAREIQYYFDRISYSNSVCIALFILLLNTFWCTYIDEFIMLYLFFDIIFVGGILYLFFYRRKLRCSFLQAVERGYYLSSQSDICDNTSKAEGEKVEFEF